MMLDSCAAAQAMRACCSLTRQAQAGPLATAIFTRAAQLAGNLMKCCCLSIILEPMTCKLLSCDL